MQSADQSTNHQFTINFDPLKFHLPIHQSQVRHQVFSNKLGLEVHVISTAYQIYSGRFGAKFSKPLTPLTEVFGPDLLGGFFALKMAALGVAGAKDKKVDWRSQDFWGQETGKNMAFCRWWWWWFFEAPIWKIWLSNWIISPKVSVENKKMFETTT